MVSKTIKQTCIINFHQDLAQATTFKVQPRLSFEPDEVRLLQYGIMNTDVAVTGGVLICKELSDFHVIICATPETSIAQSVKLHCVSKGPLETLTFSFVVGGDNNAPMAVLPGNDIWGVLQFIKH